VKAVAGVGTSVHAVSPAMGPESIESHYPPLAQGAGKRFPGKEHGISGRENRDRAVSFGYSTVESMVEQILGTRARLCGHGRVVHCPGDRAA
jgi:hypothetical protein